MKYISFAIPCYNSQDYMAHAIESILPGGDEVEIIIVNDGSKDKTRDIIKRFASEDDRIVFVNPDQTENLGVIKSFFTLLKYQESDYYLFSDQDDTWLPEKLSLQLEKASHYPSDKPLLVYYGFKRL